ncbi:hypothetical protein BJX66DRAFT_317226 [Aspergillus keveii]|jgi:hypothetical protein|uniref:Uncharacterized protein n=1 Tax=Aspergillus keveii TaxID=714993 RepID=A0ABR4FLJ5_9EURO
METKPPPLRSFLSSCTIVLPQETRSNQCAEGISSSAIPMKAIQITYAVDLAAPGSLWKDSQGALITPRES